MDILIVTPVRVDDTPVIDPLIEVSFDGAPFETAAGGAIPLPEGPRPITFDLKVSANEDVFPVQGKLTYKGAGEVVVSAGDIEAFAPARAAVLGNSAAVSLIVVLSMLRDVTAQVIGVDGVASPSLRGGADRRPGYQLPRDFTNVSARPDRNFLSDPPLDDNGDLAFEVVDDVDPSAEHVVFEAKVPKAPKLISVTWPSGVPRVSGAAAPDTLVYFHPNVGQNFQFGFYHGPYPFSWDYMYFGIVTYVWYAADPLRVGNGWKGIPFQIAAADRNVVTVLPVNGMNVELGVFLEAKWMELALKEIISMMMRRKGVFRPEKLGRVGLAAFSAGVPNVTAFLARNKASAFAKTVLKEVYAFEPPSDGVTGWCAAATAWLADDADGDKRARCYTLGSHPADFQKVLGRPVTEKAPHFATSADGNRTTAVIPIASCLKASGQKPADTFQFSHQFVSDLFLTHAMRTSGFEK